MLAARYGFRVSVDSVSPYGGVRAVVLLPAELLSSEVAAPATAVHGEHQAAHGDHQGARGDYQAPPAEQPAPAWAQAPGQRLVSLPEPAAPLAPVPPAAVTEPEMTADGQLPRRRRHRPVSVLPSPQDPGRAETPVRSPGQNTPSRLGAFQRGTLSGRNTTNTEGTEIQ